MTQIEFTPEAWQRGGQAYQQEAQDLASGIENYVSALSVEALGCYNGEHIFDAAISIVVPLVKQAFVEAAYNLAANIFLVGETMAHTGAIYDNVEQQTTDYASRADVI